jgi:hypothetical protein
LPDGSCSKQEIRKQIEDPKDILEGGRGKCNSPRKVAIEADSMEVLQDAGGSVKYIDHARLYIAHSNDRPCSRNISDCVPVVVDYFEHICWNVGGVRFARIYQRIIGKDVDRSLHYSVDYVPSVPSGVVGVRRGSSDCNSEIWMFAFLLRSFLSHWSL